MKSSILIQEEKKIVQTEPNKADSKKAKSDNINASIIEKVDKNLEPETPIKRPSRLDEKKPKKGKSNISKNIIKSKFLYLWAHREFCQIFALNSS